MGQAGILARHDRDRDRFALVIIGTVHGYSPVPAPIHNGWRVVWVGVWAATPSGAFALLAGAFRLPFSRRG